jgi:azobenzene reductase
MKIVGFNGSLSATSNTYKGVKAALDASHEHGAEVTLYDLRENPLPLFHPDHCEQLQDDNVRLFTQLLSEADGIVLGSPEYHNSLSGAFKNAIDWVGTNQFKNKPVALVSAAGGPLSLATLTTMQTMIRSLHGWVVPVFGSISGSTTFNEDGSFKDSSMQKRFKMIGFELVNMAELLRNKRF